MCSDSLRRGAPCTLGPFITFAKPPSGCSPTRHSSPDFQSVLRRDPLVCVHRLTGPPERTVVLVPSAGCTASPPQPLCVRRLLITNTTIVGGHGGRAGVPLFTGAIFCHRAGVAHSSSNGGLNSPDSCILCLVTLCAGLCPSPFYAGTNNFWFSLSAQCGWVSHKFYFFSILSCRSAIFSPGSGKYSSG